MTTHRRIASLVLAVLLMFYISPCVFAQPIPKTPQRGNLSLTEHTVPKATITPESTPTATPSPSQTPSPSPTPSTRTSAGYTEGQTYTMRIYHYCNCTRCTPGTGITASGKKAQNGMVAMYGLPFGTVIEINGKQYTVEDRGVGRMKVDIYCEEGHQYATNKGTYTAKVKIVKIGGCINGKKD